MNNKTVEGHNVKNHVSRKDMNQYRKAYNKAVRKGNFKDLDQVCQYLTTKYVGRIDISTGEVF